MPLFSLKVGALLTVLLVSVCRVVANSDQDVFLAHLGIEPKHFARAVLIDDFYHLTKLVNVSEKNQMPELELNCSRFLTFANQNSLTKKRTKRNRAVTSCGHSAMLFDWHHRERCFRRATELPDF